MILPVTQSQEDEVTQSPQVGSQGRRCQRLDVVQDHAHENSTPGLQKEVNSYYDDDNDNFTKLKSNGNEGESMSQGKQSTRDIHLARNITVEIKPLQNVHGKYMQPHLNRVGHADLESKLEAIDAAND